MSKFKYGSSKSMLETLAAPDMEESATIGAERECFKMEEE